MDSHKQECLENTSLSAAVVRFILFPHVEDGFKSMDQVLATKWVNTVVFVNASRVCSLWQMKSAVYTAIHNPSNKCKSLETELLYRLAPCSSVGDSIKYLSPVGAESVVVIIAVKQDQLSTADDQKILQLNDNKGILLDDKNEYLFGKDRDFLRESYGITKAEIETSGYQDDKAMIARIVVKDL